MSTSLTVQQRHLALPESCLFAPTELSIPETLTQNDFSSLGKALSSVDKASDMWACDYALAGKKRWADEGLKLAAVATKLSVGYLKVSARIAERFDPARRFPNLTREHYRGLCCFPVEFTDKWLPTVVEKGFGAKTLRALAVEAYGSDPKKGYSKNKQRSFAIPETLFARLKEASPIPKVAVFIKVVLEEWLNTATTEQQSRVAAFLLTLEEANHQRRRAERNEKIAEKNAARDAREAAALKAKEEKKEFYEAEHRKREAAALARKEEKIAAKEKVRAEREAARVKNQSIRGIEISFRGSCGIGKTSKWETLEEASAAAARYEAVKKYPIEGFLCEKCSRYHIRCDEKRFAEDFARAKQRAREIQAHVGACPSDDLASSNAETRPNYAERRQAGMISNTSVHALFRDS